MKKKFTIQQRLILPIILLGVVALISNILSVFSINNVNSNASKIVDDYMVESETSGIRLQISTSWRYPILLRRTIIL